MCPPSEFDGAGLGQQRLCLHGKASPFELDRHHRLRVHDEAQPFELDRAWQGQHRLHLCEGAPPSEFYEQHQLCLRDGA